MSVERNIERKRWQHAKLIFASSIILEDLLHFLKKCFSSPLENFKTVSKNDSFGLSRLKVLHSLDTNRQASQAHYYNYMVRALSTLIDPVRVQLQPPLREALVEMTSDQGRSCRHTREIIETWEDGVSSRSKCIGFLNRARSLQPVMSQPWAISALKERSKL
jgi:hypothetical protein